MTKDGIWENYKRVVSPASKKKKVAAAKPAPEKAAARQAAETAPVVLHRLSAGVDLPDAQPLERRREKALRQGAIEIDARLDLHGMTQTQAFEALAKFMETKSKAGKRHLLIITGKGPGGNGVLRKNLKSWLQHLPQAKDILALRPAALTHGGDGAFYVLMRRGR